jgi:hypothetical protein
LAKGAFHQTPAPFDLFIVDTVVNNTDPTLTDTDRQSDGETSIAVNSLNPDEIAITSFAEAWGAHRTPLALDGQRLKTMVKR